MTPERKVCLHVLDRGGDDGACGECYGAVKDALDAAERERDEARAKVPHPGDGTCDICGALHARPVTAICVECRAAALDRTKGGA